MSGAVPPAGGAGFLQDAPPTSDDRGPGPGPRILIVDDEPHVARVLEGLLAQQGFASERVDSGEAALQRLEAGDIDLVLLDVRLPGMDGIEICTRVRERFGPALPILILTAFGDAATLRQGYDAGADDFLKKPIDSPQLILKVRAFLRLKSLHDEMSRNRQVAQARARDLALLHEIGRDWSLIAAPEEFNGTVTSRLSALIGAPIVLIALYDPATRLLAAALPVHGMPDEQARRMRYTVKPEYRSLLNFRSGRAYVSNRARGDPRLLAEMVQAADADSVVLVPMVAEGRVLGLVAALNKPGGFTDADVQLLTVFAGPAASFLRSRQIFAQQRGHAARLERVAALVGDMAAESGRVALLQLAVSRIHSDFGYDRVAFHAASPPDEFRTEAEAGLERPAGLAPDRDLLRWALRGAMPLQAARGDHAAELAVPVRAGEHALGVLEALRPSGEAFGEEEVNLLSALAGQLAVALQKAESVARTERMARQMATLYDVGLKTTALRDLRALFTKAAEEAGRLIHADHSSILRLDSAATLRVFGAWSRDPVNEVFHDPTFRMGEGVAGRVAETLVPALVNEAAGHPGFVPRGNPIARLISVPVTYYEAGHADHTLFGVLNASRKPGGAPFTPEDLEYITRFAGQLSIALANSVAFAAERERSEQLALVNAVMREISGTLSRERILDTAVRRIQEAFRYPVVAIMVPDRATGRQHIEAVVSRIDLTDERSFPLSGGVAGRALRERATMVVDDVLSDPDYIPVSAATRSDVAVPIFSGDDVVAVLSVESDAPAAFDHGKVITLETLADAIGIALRNAELYNELERTNARLVELDRMKSELVNIVAHDFRAPLAGVLGHAELLEWRPDAPRADRIDQARAIIYAATHMANLVDKTLKTTRLETGQFPFDFGLLDLSAVGRETVKRLPVRATHPLVVEIPDEPLPCWGDRDRMAEVLDNLISNAIKYSPDGGTVSMRLERVDDEAVVRVTDRGIGIEAADLGRLFRPFSRVRDLRTAEIEGSGLGLYICERIVRAHGGRLWVESEPGRGSVFSFSLPLYGAAPASGLPLVLVAAPDERTRREVRRVAEELGFEIHEVGDGVEAVEAALRLVPAALVLDRVMPRLRADEVAERLRDSPATEHVPLFVLAAESELGERSALFSAFVPKPLDRAALAAALEALRTARPRP